MKGRATRRAASALGARAASKVTECILPLRFRPFYMAIHAFHCTDPACKMPRCADAKLILLKIQSHAQQRYCAVRELLGIDVECKVCKLWRVLHNSRAPRAPSGSSTNVNELPLIPQDLPQELPLIPLELPHHETPQENPQIPQEVSEALRLRLRPRLRELPPDQVKRMLISHVRNCRNRWRCGTCRKVRERLATLRLQL